MSQLSDSPIIEINGVRIANFSSAHSFEFDTGDVLPACSAEHAEAMKLNVVESKYERALWVDIEIRFEMSTAVYDHLSILAGDPDIDVILVPLPVLQAMKELMADIDLRARLPMDYLIRDKIRCIRRVDRTSGKIYSDRFCI